MTLKTIIPFSAAHSVIGQKRECSRGNLTSLRGKRLKGKGKEVLGARKTREASGSGSRTQNSLSIPFQTPAKQARIQPDRF